MRTLALLILALLAVTTACESAPPTVAGLDFGARPTPTPLLPPSPISTPTPVLAPTVTPQVTQTPTHPPTLTPTPLLTPAPTPTPSPTAIPSLTPTPAPAATSSPTPVPAAEPVMETAAEIVGYRSDGTADVTVTVSLENQIGSPLGGVQDIVVTCHRDGAVVSGCPESVAIELQGESGAAETAFTLRTPMGTSSLAVSFSTNGGLSDTIEVNVPERVWGLTGTFGNATAGTRTP